MPTEMWQDSVRGWAGECEGLSARGRVGQVGAGPHGFPFSHPYQAGSGIPSLHCTFKGPQILERVWVLETKPPEGREPDSQAPAPRVPAGE